MNLTEAVQALHTGRLTARALVERCLERIEDPGGEGARTFLASYGGQARASADAIDALRRAGRAPGPYAGIPVSLKDLLDVAGEPTRAGSVALHDAPPAERHALVVARLLAAGLVPVGRTNMTEFAFSGLGINPHHDTPRGPWDRATGRIPGGSSSGAAVSITDEMALVAIGTDTGGSCRIPAAFCGIVGYKPTARRVPTEGVLPLSPSLDSVGPLARSVACCAIVDAILAGEPPAPPLPIDVAGLRLAVPATIVLDGLDTAIARAFERALETLSAAGARIVELAMPVLDLVAEANALGGFSVAEAWAYHRNLLATRGALVDPRVAARIRRGEAQTASDYIELIAARPRLIAEADRASAAFDALVMPTAPLVPPTLASLAPPPAGASDTAYAQANMLALRNPSLFNFLDRCAISLPMHRLGEAPAGLMLVGETGGDRRLFAVAAGIEAALERQRG